MFKKLFVLFVFAAIVMIALPVLAKKNTANLAVVDITCIKNAIEKRDNAVISALNIFNSSVSLALTARKDALKAAWDLTDKAQRKEALKTAWGNYKTSLKDARTALREAKKTIWKQFYTDRKACGKAVSGEDNSSEGTDANI